MSGRASPTADGGRVTRFLIAGLVGVYLLFAYSLAINTHHGVGPGGAPPFYDFGAFYQAGALADSGNATGAYNDAAMVAAERSAFPGTTTRLPWNYPPTFLLPFMPLAALPYVVAWAAWSGLTYGLYVLAVRRLVAPYQLWLMLLAPAAAVNLFVGQNGTLSVALIAGGVLLLRNRPIVAGMVLGLLAYKPQFAVLAPLVLLCGREWRALISAAVSWTALSLLSVVILGVDPWIAFLHKAAAPANIFTSSSSSWLAIPSTMILARSLGLGPTVSSVLHWSVALVAAVGALWVWIRTRDARLRAAVLAGATLLVTPYLRSYDLALLILPVAALLPMRGERIGMAGRAVMFAAWVAPAALTFTSPPIQYGALISAVALGAVLWRATRLVSSPGAATAPA